MLAKILVPCSPEALAAIWKEVLDLEDAAKGALEKLAGPDVTLDLGHENARYLTPPPPDADWELSTKEVRTSGGVKHIEDTWRRRIQQYY